MQVRRQKRLLALGVALLMGIAALAVSWPLLNALDMPKVKAVQSKQAEQPHSPPEPVPTVEEFALLWNKRLQRPLVDPVIVKAPEVKIENKAPPPPPPRPPAPNWKLVGVYFNESSPDSSIFCEVAGLGIKKGGGLYANSCAA